jgi:hypothetical protein
MFSGWEPGEQDVVLETRAYGFCELSCFQIDSDDPSCIVTEVDNISESSYLA